jgi:uncharacterized protein (DUF169 family)
MSKPSISTDQQGRPAKPDWAENAERLVSALRLSAPPVAISFHRHLREGAPTPAVAPYNAPFAPAADGGRTGRVAAGCAFWIEAATAEFSTVAGDHANCRVGSVTHGFKTVPRRYRQRRYRCVAGSRMGRRIRFCDPAQPGEGTGAGGAAAAYDMKEE